MSAQDHPVEDLQHTLSRLAEQARTVTTAANAVRARPPSTAALANDWSETAARRWSSDGAVAVEQVLTNAVSIAHAVDRLLEAAGGGAGAAPSGDVGPGLAILQRDLDRATAQARAAVEAIAALRAGTAGQSPADQGTDALAQALEDLLADASTVPDQLTAAGAAARAALQDAWSTSQAGSASFVAQQTRDRWRGLSAAVAASRGA